MRGKFLAAAAAAILFSVSAQAQTDEDELPSVYALPCVKECANSTPAKGITRVMPRYPDTLKQRGRLFVEGYVKLSYMINPDGHISNIEVLASVGPRQMVDYTVDAVQHWTYEPATLKGKPVATCRTLLMTFRNPHEDPVARPAVVGAYQGAMRAIKDGKWDDASAILADARKQEDINLYENGMLANLQSLIALQKGDMLEAHRLSVLALSYSSQSLPRGVKRTLLETRARSAAMTGDIVDALDAVDELKTTDDGGSPNPVVSFIEATKEKADSMPVFGASARIPQSGQNAYSFKLYRRVFTFQNISGSLDHFTLSCKQQAIESKVSQTAEWHVPASWNGCRIFVFGAPGTTFKIVEATSPS